MWLIVMKFLKNPKALLQVGAAIIVAAALSFTVWKWNDMEHTISSQATTISSQASRLAAKDLEITSAKNARIAIEKRLATQQALNETLTDIRGTIHAASDEDDGPIAPVLGATFRDLGLVRNEADGDSGAGDS